MGLILTTEARADRLSEIKQRGSLICATYFAVPPFGFPDPVTRQPTGYDVDMCAAVAKHLGVSMQHKAIAVEGRVPELALGRVDIVSALLPYTKTFAEAIAFSDAIFDYSTRVIVPSSSDFTRLSEFAGKKVSMTRGTANEARFKARVPTVEILTYQDSAASFLALQQGKVQGYATVAFAGQRFINDTNGKFKFVDEALHTDVSALGVKKGEAELLDAVNDALAKMEAAGEIDAIWNKWLGPNTKYFSPRGRKLTPIAKIAQ